MNCAQCGKPITGCCAMMRGMWFHLGQKPDGSSAETKREESCLETYLKEHEYDA
jgi:hypothetical protein